jgi:hypothetical protein
MLVIILLVTSSLAVLKPGYAINAGTVPNIYLTKGTPPAPPLPPASNVSYTTNTATVGTLFNVTVWVNNTDLLGGADITVKYNDTVINVTKWYVPTYAQDFFMPAPYTALPAPPGFTFTRIGPGKCSVHVAVSEGQLPPAPPWGVNGSIAIFQFKVLLLPDKYGQLNTTLDMSASFILDTAGNTVVGTVLQNGFYQITWAAPSAHPYMGLTPLNYDFNPGPFYNVNVNGSTLDEKVYIRNLDSGWALTEANFTLTYNSTVLAVEGAPDANITLALGWSNTSDIGYAPGSITLNLTGPASPGSHPPIDVLVATIRFTVILQEVNGPSWPVGSWIWSTQAFSSVTFRDHTTTIKADTSETGKVKVYTLVALPLPYKEVIPAITTLGPTPALGQEFDVNVTIQHMSPAWHIIGLMFRIFYNSTVIAPVSVAAGPFFEDGPEQGWNHYGLFFFALDEGVSLYAPYDDIIVSMILLPDSHGSYNWMTSFANDTGMTDSQRTVATIRFKEILMQDYLTTYESPLNLTDVFGEEGIDWNGTYVPFFAPVNGEVIVLPLNEPGRAIDLYGGAKNDGYWTGYPAPFLAPWGGQGPNQPMDLVFPQSEITLYAYLSYNYWPVQSKDVGFEIEGPFEKIGGQLVPAPTYEIWAKLVASTNGSGIARITFRMPWPCMNPDTITGVWKITATATIGDQVVMDTMPFYYERVVYITSVTTNKLNYLHLDTVKVTVDYETHSEQFYPALFSVVILDNLSVPIGMGLFDTQVGGAVFCTWTTGEIQLGIPIPKWAYSGACTVEVNVYDKDPTLGGEAYEPEFGTPGWYFPPWVLPPPIFPDWWIAPIIYILPY